MLSRFLGVHVLGGDMKKLVSVLMALIVAPLIAAGSGVAGKWTSGKQSTVPVELQLLSSGTALSGTVRLGSAPAVDILDGKVVGNTITFKAIIPDGDGDYPMMFSGRLSGNRIDFRCNVEVNVPGEKVEVGAACVSRLSVRRAAR
jgi:hypothetical protein